MTAFSTCRTACALLACLVAVGCAAPSDDGSAPGSDDGRARLAAAPDASPPMTSASIDGGAPAAGGGVTFTVEGTTRAQLVVAGARCGGTRCTFATPPPGGTARVDLTLRSDGVGDMPVWVRWRGCGEYDGQLWPVWQSNPPSYETLYTHVFQGLTAGSACVAEVAQGSWYVFAGDLTVRATTNPQFCRDQYSSPENLNLHCFVPAQEAVSITSGLRSWECFSQGAQRGTTSVVHRQGDLTFTAAGNEVVSCLGSAR